MVLCVVFMLCHYCAILWSWVWDCVVLGESVVLCVFACVVLCACLRGRVFVRVRAFVCVTRLCGLRVTPVRVCAVVVCSFVFLCVVGVRVALWRMCVCACVCVCVCHTRACVGMYARCVRASVCTSVYGWTAVVLVRVVWQACKFYML